MAAPPFPRAKSKTAPTTPHPQSGASPSHRLTQTQLSRRARLNDSSRIVAFGTPSKQRSDTPAGSSAASLAPPSVHACAAQTHTCGRYADRSRAAAQWGRPCAGLGLGPGPALANVDRCGRFVSPRCVRFRGRRLWRGGSSSGWQVLGGGCGGAARYRNTPKR